MTTDITELAQSLKAESISPERMEWLKKLADMKYCASNPGHWLMSLKETNYLAAVALQCIEKNLALAEALEKAQQRITQLESRTVKMPEPFKLAKSSSGLTYYFADDVDAALTAAGIKVEGE